MGSALEKKESFSAFGFVEIHPFDVKEGKRCYRRDEVSRCNLIVEKGRETLMDTLIGASSQRLRYIRWGKGGALLYPEGDPRIPLEVSDDDEDLNTPILDRVLGTPNRISKTEVQYNEVLISDEIDDVVNEAAMMFENVDTGERTIFARITFPTFDLRATRGRGIELKWTFNFTRARNTEG